MIARKLFFTSPGEVSIRGIKIKDPGEDEVVVKALYCGISSGTERLAFRGEIPENMLLDETIDELQKKAEYPFSYGYILIGRVLKTGSRKNSHLEGKTVLVFHPHQDIAVVKAERLIPLPDNLPPQMAVLIPSCETAVSILQDASPVMGERAAVFGLGLIGRISAHMLSKYPLEKLLLIDPSPYRRKLSSGIENCKILNSSSLSKESGNFDLALELSGNPDALQSALDITGYSGRVLVGSWYGKKQLSLDLGSSFHRKRLNIFSSQVSTISPGLRGRWTHERRMETALNWLLRYGNPSWITHNILFENVSEAYEIINNPGGEYLQVILDMT